MDADGLAIVDLSQPAEVVARDIAAACATSGCFHLVQHGISPRLLADVWQAMDTFFDLALPQKQQCQPANAADDRGYSSFGTENVAAFMGRRGEPNDPVEKFAFSNPAIVDPAIDVHARPNVWPPVDGFQSTMEAYYAAVKALSRTLFGHFAMALGVDPTYFAARTSTAPDSVKLNYYPPSSSGRRFAEHTDSVPFTILNMDATRDALYVQTRSSRSWVPVNAQPNGLFVNLGDVLQRWTNDASIAFFVMLNGDATIECIPSCQHTTLGAKYPPITFHAFVQEKMQRLVGLP
ncbi:hypothetical protein SPRG_20527 [Saprolegnia parasitica CBS 223.65]|uniref:Fe2OG dioxygenase domain-containing protein n=1 Tax=Saprolegnia parasitica (strain CBS 223.65) TaxID=695850 RepID=A0A067C7L4_SAPPC|nr:hypothetical protein SPRG_20527 [Saprolegnia parasitica CBS 223.65]KDO26729.1 hypothetical protein SPRG_20527 [Saprolegnia parasitica CBS 223.65]|eukprot:XP_012202611.1 hypothetical protein SPRG_20527 [Saprolegnia parasitica CBS 223.65]